MIFILDSVYVVNLFIDQCTVNSPGVSGVKSA